MQDIVHNLLNQAFFAAGAIGFCWSIIWYIRRPASKPDVHAAVQPVAHTPARGMVIEALADTLLMRWYREF